MRSSLDLSRAAPGGGLAATLRGLGVAVRLPYLIGGLLLFGLGAAVGEGTLSALPFALGAVVVALVHTITHYVNDAEDVATDELSEATLFTGGSRAIQRGLVSARQLRVVSAWLAVVTLGLALVVAALGELRSAALWLAMLAGGYAYSGRPFMLGRRGLGELDVAVVMGLLVPLAGAEAAGGVGPRALAVAAIVFVEAFIARLSTAYPDLQADRATGKRTLVVLVGARGAAVAFVISAAVVLAVGVAAAPWLPWPDLQRARALLVAIFAVAAAGAILSGYAERQRVVVPVLGVLAFGLTQAVLLVAALCE
ncbi:MAG: prenyltransferase [Myxococcales bacterium]|nr:prenyltransferase [Myxococcales bacterium]